jgi:hypothetical protein
VTDNEGTQDGDMTASATTGDASGNSSSHNSNSDDLGEVPTDDDAVREEIRHGLQLASEARSVVEAALQTAFTEEDSTFHPEPPSAKAISVDMTDQDSLNETHSVSNDMARLDTLLQHKKAPLNPYKKHPRVNQPLRVPTRSSHTTSTSLTSSQDTVPQSTQGRSSPNNIDRKILLKRNISRAHIHRYTLRLKIITCCSDEEEQVLIRQELINLFSILIRADPSTIIPPYLELDRNDKSTPDLSSAFMVEATDSYSEVKKYFSRISPCKEDGADVWCSLILAQNLPFLTFMEKARHSLDNNSFSLWPKASDHESASEVGWLLYSTRQQDEGRLAEMFSSLSGENLGVKWRPIRTTDGNNRKKDSLDDSERVYALHLEAASDRARAAREKLKQYYGSGKTTQFPDGTKMRLVPPFNTILSLANKGKYATLIARQAALSSCMGVRTTWEMSTNLAQTVI